MINQKGFTLIELIIVLAIIGVLASIALTAYQNYKARSTVSEAMVLVGDLKTKVVENLTNNSCGDQSTTGTFGSAVIGGTAPNCNITYTFNNNVASVLASKVIGLDVDSYGSLKINASTNVDDAYLPSVIK